MEEFNKALKYCVQMADCNNQLYKGLRLVCKAMSNNDCKFVILAKDCSEPKYIELVKQIASLNNVKVIEFEKGETLGLWIKTCKFDLQNEPKKIKRCSSLAIKQFPRQLSKDQEALIIEQFQ